MTIEKLNDVSISLHNRAERAHKLVFVITAVKKSFDKNMPEILKMFEDFLAKVPPRLLLSFEPTQDGLLNLSDSLAEIRKFDALNPFHLLSSCTNLVFSQIKEGDRQAMSREYDHLYAQLSQLLIDELAIRGSQCN